MPLNVVIPSAGHQGSGIVVQAFERHAAEMAEGPLVPIEQRRQALMGVGPGPRPARKAEREDEDMRRLALLADPHLQLAEIDLRLLAWVCLEPDRRQGGPSALIA